LGWEYDYSDPHRYHISKLFYVYGILKQFPACFFSGLLLIEHVLETKVALKKNKNKYTFCLNYFFSNDAVVWVMIIASFQSTYLLLFFWINLSLNIIVTKESNVLEKCCWDKYRQTASIRLTIFYFYFYIFLFGEILTYLYNVILYQHLEENDYAAFFLFFFLF